MSSIKGEGALPTDDFTLSKSDDRRVGGQKSLKIDDMFYERPQTYKLHNVY